MNELTSELTPRQEMLLNLIIREYIENPSRSGVSSKTIVEDYNLNLSSATIRNEMAVLTERGYLRQPHTSAGRVPTEEGYRYFVSRVVNHQQALPLEEQRQISHQFHQARHNVESWSALAASVLARHTGTAALASAPLARHLQVRHVQIISTRGAQVLLVVVLESGDVLQHLFTLEEPYGQHELDDYSTRVTRLVSGLEPNEVELRALAVEEPERTFVQVVVGLLHSQQQALSNEIVHDGLTYLLESPHVPESSRLQTLRLFEERAFLKDFLGETLHPRVGNIQVLIGGEGSWEELRNCSIVITRYGARELATGAIGVVGPTHMAYGRAISTVRLVANLLTELVHENFG